MSDTATPSPGDSPAVDSSVPTHEPLSHVIHVPPGTFAAWQEIEERWARAMNPSTPALERARCWWDELIAVVSGSDGPLMRSGMLRKNGVIDRSRPRAAERCRESYSLEVLERLAHTLLEAGHATTVRRLPGESIGGRAFVLPLFNRALNIAEQFPSEFFADEGIRTHLANLLRSPAGQRTLAEIRDAVLNANPTPTPPAAAMKLPSAAKGAFNAHAAAQQFAFGDRLSVPSLPLAASAASGIVPRGKERSEGGTPGPAEPSILPTMLSAPDIAKRIKRKRESVTTFLSRYAAKYPDCRIENETKRRNEAKYLYRTNDVWLVLEKWMEENPEESRHD